MSYAEKVSSYSAVTLLVVEDNHRLNRIYKSHLAEHDFRVLTALNFHEAMIVLSSEQVDIALIDYDLGDRKGLDLVKHLPKKELQHHIPVIVMGSQEHPGILQRCIELGVDDYLVKPINPLQLTLKIHSLLYHVRLAKIVSAQNIQLKELLSKAQLESQMVAHIFYNHLLSSQTQSVQGLTHLLSSTAEFSGDIILARYSPSGSLYIMHADATGHGLSATVTLMPVVDIFKAMVKKGYRIESIIKEINTRTLEQLPANLFVAASFLEVDFNKCDIKVWNGGMPDLLLLDDEQRLVHQFTSRYMALGILNPPDFETQLEVIKLPSSGRLISVSDGLIEQSDPMGQIFGLNRLLMALKSHTSNAPKGLLKDLEEHVGSHVFDDDVSVFELDVKTAISSHSAVSLDQALTETLDDIGPFTWSMELVGKQIAEQELPSQCNQFLLGMGFSHTLCQRVFTLISELINNAIDHGLLKLTSLLKSGSEGFLHYYQERDVRLAHLSRADQLSLSIGWYEADLGPCLEITVEDSGTGYTSTKPEKKMSSEHEFGRGLSLVKMLATELYIEKQGSSVRALLK